MLAFLLIVVIIDKEMKKRKNFNSTAVFRENDKVLTEPHKIHKQQ